MLKLFQSIFGSEKAQQHYPESLIEMAIERAVDGTDPRLRALPGYRKRLRAPVIHAIDHVVGLVDAIPPPLLAGHDTYASEPRFSTLFASADHMLEVFSHDANLSAFLGSQNSSARRVTALLLAERVEKNILGMDLVGDSVRRDVAQVAVSFSGYRLVDPMSDEDAMRRLLKRRAFDHLLTLALTRIIEKREERADLVRQRDLLRRKLDALKRSGWSFDEAEESVRPEASNMAAELEEIEGQFKAMGADTGLLDAHLDIVASLLSTAEQQLWGETLVIRLDRMNIKRDAQDESARNIELQELHNAQGRRLVMLLVSVAPGELPKREDLHTLAQRYLA
jgi:hypothetical protein